MKTKQFAVRLDSMRVSIRLIAYPIMDQVIAFTMRWNYLEIWIKIPKIPKFVQQILKLEPDFLLLDLSRQLLTLP